MSRQFFTDIDLVQNQLLNAVLHKASSAPTSPTPVEGQFYYNTTDDKIYVYDGSAWDEMGNNTLTVAAGSQNFLSISDNEISFSNLAITGVTVDGTATSISNFVSSNYTVGNEFQEGDVIIMTAATDQASRSYIHNGGTAVSTADFTRLQADISAADIRQELSAGDGLTYTQATGVFEADVDDVTVQVGASGLELKDSGVSTAKIAADAVDKTKIAADVAGDGLGQNVDGSLEVNVDGTTLKITSDTLGLDYDVVGGQLAGDGLVYDGTNDELDVNVDDSTIEISSDAIQVKDLGISTAKVADSAVTNAKMADNSVGTAEIIDANVTTAKIADDAVTQAKLDATLEAKIVNGYAETVGDGSTTSFTITHNLGTKDVTVQIYEISSGECVECQVARDTTNALSIGVFPAPDTNDIRVLVQKLILA